MYQWNDPRRYIPQGHSQRQAVISALSGEMESERFRQAWHRLRVLTPSSSFSQDGAGGMSAFDSSCVMMGECGIKRIDYTSDFASYGAPTSKYLAASGGVRWSDDRGILNAGDPGFEQARPMAVLRQDTYHRVYEQFEKILGQGENVYEIGGRMDRHQQDVFIAPESMLSGGRSSLQIEGPTPTTANELEWHLHPNHCRRDSARCGLGWFSQQDLNNIVNRAWMGNRAHLVFAFEGTYVAHVRPSVRRTQSVDQAMAALQQNVHSRVERITSDMLGGRKSLEESIPLWVQTVNAPGSPVSVMFFPLHVGPLLPPTSQ